MLSNPFSATHITTISFLQSNPFSLHPAEIRNLSLSNITLSSKGQEYILVLFNFEFLSYPSKERNGVSCIDGDIYFNINSDYDVLSLYLHSTFLTSYLTTTLTSLYSYLALCSLDCGANGQCQGSGCVCQEGWEGNRCQHRSCDSRCSSHGQCKNGTCICQTGFNGKHCSLPACIHPAMRQISLCSGHGICDSTMIGGINNIPSNEVSDHGLEYGSHVSKLFNNMDSARPEYRYFSFGLLHQ